MQKVAIVIPARYQSSRLPGKPLLDINGKPMIQHVLEAAHKVAGVDIVVVATDDSRIMDAVLTLGYQAILTSNQHPSGTDRLIEVASQVKADIYINLQGDEPLINVADVSRLVAELKNNTAIGCASLCHEISATEAKNPNSVKVVLADDNSALYFSRSPIPYPRNHTKQAYFKHIGVYGYRAELLQNYPVAQPDSLENTESLEQLRLLSAGIKIYLLKVASAQTGVDTPECLEKVRAIMRGEAPTKPAIKLVITDVDGVLTDGRLHYTEQGESIKSFHVRDGLGMKMLMQQGIQVAVLSGRDSPVLRKRLDDLGIGLFILGSKDKGPDCQEIIKKAGVTAEETAYIGDDVIDFPAFAICGTNYTVADAADYIKDAVDVVLKAKGGEGAFREVVDLILGAVLGRVLISNLK